MISTFMPSISRQPKYEDILPLDEKRTFAITNSLKHSSI